MERAQNKMKRLILSTVIGALLIGCSSTQPTWNKEQTCETEKLAYTVYKEVLAAGGTPSKEEIIAKIAVETEGFTKISKSDCETLIEKITAMLEGGAE